MKIRLPAFIIALLILPACTQLGLSPMEQMISPSSETNPLEESASSASSSMLPIADSDEAVSSSSDASVTVVEQHVLTGGLLQTGSASAPLTLIVFTNASCTYCREFQDSFVPRLSADFVAAGKLRIVTLHFPLQKYRESNDTASLAICTALHPDFTAVKLKDCLKSAAVKTMLTGQKIIADALGVKVLPTFFLNGEKMTGLPAYADLRGAIEAAASQQ